jgi:hypothetical protein
MLNVVTVGLNEWERYTLPMLMSAQAVDPAMRLICVDNGSIPEYPQVPGVLVTRTPSKRSYAGGINWGMLGSDNGWCLVINNDIIIQKPMSERIEAELDKETLYGFDMYPPQPALFKWAYMPSWGMIFHKSLWQSVGVMDERCSPMYFEDADYCKRAVDLGFKLQVLDRADWGIYHIEVERMDERRAYMKLHMPQRNAIREYIRRKHDR